MSILITGIEIIGYQQLNAVSGATHLMIFVIRMSDVVFMGTKPIQQAM